MAVRPPRNKHLEVPNQCEGKLLILPASDRDPSGKASPMNHEGSVDHNYLNYLR